MTRQVTRPLHQILPQAVANTRFDFPYYCVTRQQDSERLPTGMKRIGYDADTRVYTFQDENGVLYESEPGNAYGILRPVVPRDSERDIRRARPNAFESSSKWPLPSFLSSLLRSSAKHVWAIHHSLVYCHNVLRQLRLITSYNFTNFTP
jgi:hypothetical protein